MTQAKGQQAAVLIGEESVAFGTVATAGFLMPIISSSVSAGRNKTTPQIIWDNRNPAAPFDGNFTVSGDIVVPVDSIAFWYWLQLMFGDPTTTGASSPYTHVFKVPTSQPSFSLEHGHTDIEKFERFVGCKISRWAMSTGGDGELTSTLSVVGATPSLQTSSFDGTPTSVSFSRLSNMHASLKEGGTSFTGGREVSLAVDFGLDADQHTIGDSGSLGDIPEGTIAVTGSLTALFEDHTLLTKALASTESSLEVTIAASASSSLIIEIPELQYELATPAIDGPKGLVARLNFVGYYSDDADESAVVVTLANTEAHGD